MFVENGERITLKCLLSRPQGREAAAKFDKAYHCRHLVIAKREPNIAPLIQF